MLVPRSAFGKQVVASRTIWNGGTLVIAWVDVELEDGVERAFINIPGVGLGTDDERRLRSFGRSLEDQGVSVLVRRAYPYAEPFLG